MIRTIKKTTGLTIILLCSLWILTGCTTNQEVPVSSDTDLEEVVLDVDQEIEVVTPAKASEDNQISYKLETVNYPEAAAIDLYLKKMDASGILWERSWKDLRLTELSPYSELVESKERLYIEVYGMLYVLSIETGENIFEPVRVGAGEYPVIDEDGSIYCIGYYDPFATKIGVDGKVMWQIDHLDGYYWPWQMKLDGDFLYIDCEPMEETSNNLLQIDNMTGEINHTYWAEQGNVIFESVTASSTLAGYPVGHVLDSNKSTGWVEGKTDDGIGESIVFEHHKPLELSKIVISNGYHKSPALYKANNRIKDLEINLSSGAFIKYTCPDDMTPIEIPLEGLTETDRIEFVIKSVYPGTTYRDTVITGISFY